MAVLPAALGHGLHPQLTATQYLCKQVVRLEQRDVVSDGTPVFVRQLLTQDCINGTIFTQSKEVSDLLHERKFMAAVRVRVFDMQRWLRVPLHGVKSAAVNATCPVFAEGGPHVVEHGINHSQKKLLFERAKRVHDRGE
jgi:hypothetical protein